MANIDDAIEYLNDLNRGVKFNRLKFEDNLKIIQSYSKRKGFSEELLNDMVKSWLKLSIPLVKWSSIGYYLIPNKRVSDDIVLQVFHWILRNNKSKDNSPKVVIALSWLSGLMDFNLLNSAVLDIYYDFFFSMLFSNTLGPMASKFVYNFTKAQDISRARACSILELTKTCRQPKDALHLVALLGLFKSHRPECVPENISSVSINIAFPKINKSFTEGFSQANARCNTQIDLSPQARLNWWTGHFTKLSQVKQKEKHILPDLEYIQLGSAIYSKHSENKTCLDFLSTHEIMVHHLSRNIDIPANILSLLVNDAGSHIILFSSPEVQSRFSYTLYQMLYNNFLRNKSNMSYNEKKYFLQRVSLFQNRLLQGIPVVSKFLGLYIFAWNGLDFFDEILSLLEWITFESGDKLYDYILELIESLFMTNDASYRCVLLDTVKRMYINIHHTATSGRKQLFLSRDDNINFMDALTKISNFIDEICEKSIISLPDNSMLQHAFLDTYIEIAEMEEKSPLPLWTVAPKCLTYNILNSLNGFSINRMLALILRYRLIYEKIKATHGKDTIKLQITLTLTYSVDYMNALWFGVLVKGRTQGNLLSCLPSSALEHINNIISDADNLLDIGHHISFAPWTYIHVPSDVAAGIEVSSWLNSSIAKCFEDIPVFIATMLVQNKEMLDVTD